MKNKINIISVLLSVVLLCGFVLAAFTAGNNTIKTSYLAGDPITGKLNISFDQEASQSQITTTFGENITLIEFLKRNNYVVSVDFNCTIPNCYPGYTAKEQITGLSLDGNSTELFGLKLVGTGILLKSINLTVVSNTPPSCIRQALVNPLGSGEYFIQNNMYTTNTCDYSYYGCFDQNLTSSAYEPIKIGLVTDRYCEKMTLPPAAAYEVGANVINSTSGSAPLEMRMYDSDWNERGNGWSLPEQSQSIEDLRCIINYSNVRADDYFVCIVNPTKAGDYEIRSEVSGKICGVTAKFADTYPRDFEISAKAMQYSDVAIELNDNSATDQGMTSMVSYINDFITQRYGGDCSKVGGCVIPFEISGKAQIISFNNTLINYVDSDGVPHDDNKIYNVVAEDSKISSKPLILEMEKTGFTIPINEAGQKLFNINLIGVNGTSSLFSGNISITPSFGFDISPKSALIGVNTRYDIITVGEVTSAWTFGDGKTGTANKTIFHDYKVPGTYDVEVDVVMADKTTAKKSFKITVGDPKESAAKMIEIYEGRLANISGELSSFQGWVGQELDNKLDATGLSAKLVQIKNNYELAIDDSDYLKVVNDLVALNVPEAVATSKTGSLPLLAGYQNIDTKYIEEISNTPADNKDVLKKSIVEWMNQNYNVSVDYEVISQFADGEETPIMTRFLINVEPKTAGAIGETRYLILNYPQESIKFANMYNDKKAGDGSGVYISLSDTKETIEFALPGEVGVADLGGYISKDISRGLGTSSEITYFQKPSIVGTLVFWWGFIILLTLAGYIALQEWYKKNYENYLFKNKDDLYNLINFIYNSRVSGLKDVEIEKKLLEKLWKKEQITYAFKKIDNKRTGMYEIPIFKYIEFKKIKEELLKRQKKPLNTKFIKMSPVKK